MDQKLKNVSFFHSFKLWVLSILSVDSSVKVMRFSRFVRAKFYSDFNFFCSLKDPSKINFEKPSLSVIKKEQVLRFIDKVKPVSIDLPLIRIGALGDGGYLVPDDLSELKACFSPGVSSTSFFENDLAKRGIQCFLADFSVDGSSIKNELFDFEKKYLGNEDKDNFMRLDTWVSLKASGLSDFILQMDIEGAEYEVIKSTDVEILKKFRTIVIEFHGMHMLFDSGFDQINATFDKLLDVFDVVHIHPNNHFASIEVDGISVPPLLEVTFYRKDLVNKTIKPLSFPHKYDSKNVFSKKDLILPKCWW